jgi:hypothetical protein
VKSKRNVGQKPPFRLAQEDVDPRGGAEPLEAALKCLGPFGGEKIEHSAADEKQFAEHNIFEIASSTIGIGCKARVLPVQRWSKSHSMTS